MEGSAAAEGARRRSRYRQTPEEARRTRRYSTSGPHVRACNVNPTEKDHPRHTSCQNGRQQAHALSLHGNFATPLVDLLGKGGGARQSLLRCCTPSATSVCGVHSWQRGAPPMHELPRVLRVSLRKYVRMLAVCHTRGCGSIRRARDLSRDSVSAKRQPLARVSLTLPS